MKRHFDLMSFCKNLAPIIVITFNTNITNVAKTKIDGLGFFFHLLTLAFFTNMHFCDILIFYYIIGLNQNILIFYIFSSISPWVSNIFKLFCNSETERSLLSIKVYLKLRIHPLLVNFILFLIRRKKLTKI